MAWMSASGTLSDAHDGLSMAFGLNEMINDYAFWQLYDAEWAMDWSMSDDGYSGSMIALAVAEQSSTGERAVATGFKFKKPRNPMDPRSGPGSVYRQVGRMTRDLEYPKPSRQQVRDAIRKAQEKLGGGSIPRDKGPSKKDHPRWTDGVREYRLDPPHPRSRNPAEHDWHVNWRNRATGEEGVVELGVIPR